MDKTTELQALAKTRQDALLSKAKYEQKLTSLRETETQLLDTLKTTGVTIDNLNQTVETLNLDIEDKIAAAKEEFKC